VTDGSALVALAALLGLACNFLGHSLAAILTAGRRVALAVMAGFVTGLVAAAVCTGLGFSCRAFAPADILAYSAFNLVIYLALSYDYFNFVNLNMVSLRIRVLQELLAADAGLSQDDLLRQYNAEELISRRIVRLMELGYLLEQEGRYQHRGVGLLLLARIITSLKWLVLGHGNRTCEAALARDSANHGVAKGA
jgi:hypothetical protein